MKKITLIMIGLIWFYVAFMKPWECVKTRVDGGGEGTGMNGDWATWVDCSY